MSAIQEPAECPWRPEEEIGEPTLHQHVETVHHGSPWEDADE